MNFLTRNDYQRVVLYILTSVSVLLVLKFFLPYFLPLLVALVIVVPLQRFCQRRERFVVSEDTEAEETETRGNNKIRTRSGQKGFMAGGILFGIILIVALIIVGLGTFLISKARTFVQNADFSKGSVRRSRNSSSCREELSSAGSRTGWQSSGNALRGLETDC